MILCSMFIRLLTASVIVLALSGVSFMRAGLYQDGILLFTDTAAKSPNKERVLNNLALDLMKAERFREAIPVIEQTLIINPDYLPAMSNKALAFYALGLKADAERVFTEIVERYPLSKEAAFAGNMIAFIRRGKER